MRAKYDRSGRRAPTVREAVPLGGYVAAFVTGCALAIAALTAWLWWDSRQTVGTHAPVSYLGAVGTVRDGGDIRVYTWTDPDSMRVYLITDRGGICERGGNEDA